VFIETLPSSDQFLLDTLSGPFSCQVTRKCGHYNILIFWRSTHASLSCLEIIFRMSSKYYRQIALNDFPEIQNETVSIIVILQGYEKVTRSVRTAAALGKIRTKHLPNISRSHTVSGQLVTRPGFESITSRIQV
jgi:hypothetical protein